MWERGWENGGEKKDTKLRANGTKGATLSCAERSHGTVGGRFSIQQRHQRRCSLLQRHPPSRHRWPSEERVPIMRAEQQRRWSASPPGPY